MRRPSYFNIAVTLMSSSRIFSEVTEETLTRLKTVGRTQYSVVFLDPPEGPRSSAISQTPFGECMLNSNTI